MKAAQLTEHDQMLPVIINYPVNTSSGGGGILIGRRTGKFSNVSCSSALHRMLMPSGKGVYEVKAILGGSLCLSFQVY